MANITTQEITDAEKAAAVAVCSSIPWAKIAKYLVPKAESYASKRGKAIVSKLSKSGGCFSSCCGSLTTCIPCLSPTSSTSTSTDADDAASFIDYPNPFKEATTSSKTAAKAAALRVSSRSSSRVSRPSRANDALQATGLKTQYSNPVSPKTTARTYANLRTNVNRATVRSAIFTPSAFDPNAVHQV